jgi:hypothetical protein
MPKPFQPLFSIVAWLLLFGLVFIALGPLHPSLPAAGLDPSWVQVINTAYLHHWQWGRDIVFTYGPLGFLYTKAFHPQLFTSLLLYWLLIGSAFSLAIAAIFSQRPWSINILALAMASFLLPLFSAGFDAFFLLLCTLVLLHYVYGRAALFRSIQTLLISAIAAVALMKTTIAIFAIVNLLLIDWLRLSNKRPPIHLLLWGVLYLLFYLAAGQQLSNLPAYWHSALEIVRGYAPAMSIVGAETELITFLAFSAVSLLGCLASLWPRPSLPRVLIALSLGALWFFSYKQGFTRHDGHSHSAWLGLFFLLLISLQVLWQTRLSRALPTAATLFALLLLALTGSQGKMHEQWQTLADSSLDFWRARVTDAVAFVRQPLAWRADKTSEFETAVKRLGWNYPWLKPGTQTDTIPSIQSQIIFSPADYTPRPVFQEYSTYTADLIELNRRFFNDTPPELLIFSPQTIDGRFPALTEGSSWPTIFNNYQAVALHDGHIIFKRRARRLNIQPTFVAKLQGRLGEALTLPKTQGFTFVQIDTKKTPIGKIAALLLKDNQLHMHFSRDGHPAGSYRLIPAIAQQGFFSNPLFISELDLMEAFLSSQQGVVDTPSTNLELREQAFFGQSQYAQDFSVRVYQYDYRDQDMLSGALTKHWEKHAVNHRLVASAGLGRPFVYAQQNLIYAHTSTRMSINIHDISAVDIDYGIRVGDKTHRICFEMVLARPASALESRQDCIAHIPRQQNKPHRSYRWNFDPPASGYLGIRISCVSPSCDRPWAAYLANLTLMPATAAAAAP